ncbi:acid protease [Calocera viscosa TUFC12733]|uniref:Acid protease n=1 Tax=Calocera viscosa (strain TUFC12733) TaxID=1330018 RepID=A0A167MG79_CALVF|nr:acid protease [Calocera viscosa TUFC12733]
MSRIARFATTLLLILPLVCAAPFSPRPSNGLALPLKRAQRSQTDVPREIAHRQIIHSDLKRFAKFANSAAPNEAQMADTISQSAVELGLYTDYMYNATIRKVLPGSSTKRAVTMADPASDPKASEGLDIDGNDGLYLASVMIGTPSKEFLIMMDSGSGDFWVGATGCQIMVADSNGNIEGTDQPCASSHPYLGSTTSSTLVNTKVSFEDFYGTGGVSGVIVSDQVELAGFAMPNYKFGMATLEEAIFSGMSGDGLMGLSKSSLSQMGLPSPAQYLYNGGAIPEPITSIKISRLSDGLNDGEITFGSLDTTKYVADTLVTLSADNSGFWIGTADGVTVNGNSVGTLSVSSVVFDTGTSYLYGPLNDVRNIYAQIPGSVENPDQSFYIPCDASASVAFTFGGQNFSIDPRDLVTFQATASNMCATTIGGSGGNPTSWLLGDTFLKNVYISLNEKANTIQLAKLA